MEFTTAYLTVRLPVRVWKRSMRNSTLTVIPDCPDLSDTGKLARIAQIGTSLSELQAAVDGNIEPFYPYEEQVCIVCDDEGKICGKPLNRAIYNEDGTIMDIMAGTFFICDCSKPSFGSLSKEQQQRFVNQFKYPESFFRINEEIKAVKYKPERNEVR